MIDPDEPIKGPAIRPREYIIDRLEERRLLSTTFNGGLTFIPNSSTSNAIVTADFNGDGIPDIATATASTNEISVYIGLGNGSFQAPVTYLAGFDPVAIAAADLNNDGKIDLVVGNGTGNKVNVLLGNGDGTFASSTSYNAGTGAEGVAIGDVNNDGKPDILATNNGSNTTTLLLGNGDGTFSAGTTINEAGGPVGIAVGDFNHDGNLDFVTANKTANLVMVHLGNGDGTFQAGTPFAINSQPTGVVVGDLNNDGKLDIATANFGTSSVSVLLGTGTGSFQPAVNYDVQGQAQQIILADVNADDFPDIVTADDLDSQLSVSLNNHDGTFSTATVLPISQGVSDVASDDFNNDGLPDLAVAISQGTPQIGLALNSYAQSPTPDVSLTVTPSQTEYGDPVTMTAQVSGSGPLPTGYVSFFDGSVLLNQVPLDSTGTATLTTTTLNFAGHGITAQYSGDGDYAGQTSNLASVLVDDPTPTLTGLSQNSVTAGSSGTIVALFGSNFNSSSLVYVNGIQRAATVENSNTIDLTLDDTDFAQAGTLEIQVLNNAFGGGETAPLPFTVTDPPPEIDSITPDTLSAGGPDQTIEISGNGFVATSEVEVDGVVRPSTFISQNELDFTMTAADLATAGSKDIAVANGPAFSNTVQFTAFDQIPVINSISPGAAPAGTPGQGVAVFGSLFSGDAIVEVNGVQQPTTYVNSNELDFTLATTDLATPDILTISVVNGPYSSNSVPFTVTNSSPVIDSISPGGAPTGSPAQAITIVGNNFVATSLVKVNGVTRPAAFVNANEVDFSLTSTDLATPGILTISVVNGPDVSNSVQFNVGNVVLQPVSLSLNATPGTTTFGNPVTITAQVGGTTPQPTGYVAFFNGENLLGQAPLAADGTATFVISTLPPGSYNVTAIYSGDANYMVVGSNPVSFSVNGLAPTITSTSPTFTDAGSDAFNIGVLGTNFDSTSIVFVNGVQRAATFVSNSLIALPLTNTDLAEPGVLNIVVVNTDSAQQSDPYGFLVTPAAPVVMSITPATALVNSLPLTVSVFGTGFEAVTQVQVNGVVMQTTNLSDTEVQFTLPAADLATAGTLQVSVINGEGPNTASNQVAFNVTNPAIKATAKPIKVSAAATFTGSVATFIDPSTTVEPGTKATTAAPPYQVKINWGDGTITAGTVSSTRAGFVVNGSHVYTTTGAYQFKVQITKTGGASATASAAASIGKPAQANQQFAALAYQVLLGRLITAAELKKVVKELNSGMSHYKLVLSIESTQEYREVLINRHFQQGVSGAHVPPGVPSASHIVKARRDYHRLQTLLLDSRG